jgi:hypothetical protein
MNEMSVPERLELQINNYPNDDIRSISEWSAAYIYPEKRPTKAVEYPKIYKV